MSNANLEVHSFWKQKRVIVTGGAGFLGSFVVEKLKERGAGEIIVPHIEEYDLCKIEDIQRLFKEVEESSATPQTPFADVVIIHLAALAGGIGANRARPAEFFYINLMMCTAHARSLEARGGKVRRDWHDLRLS